MLPRSIELHLQIASPSLIGLPCELGIVHFTQAIYPELLKRKKRKRKNGSRQNCFLYQIYFNTIGLRFYRYDSLLAVF